MHSRIWSICPCTSSLLLIIRQTSESGGLTNGYRHMSCSHISMLITLRSMDSVFLGDSAVTTRASACVGDVGTWMKSHCNSTLRKPRFSGVQRLVGSTRLQTTQWWWAWILFNPSSMSGISAFTWCRSVDADAFQAASSWLAVLHQICSISRSIRRSVVQSRIVSYMSHFRLQWCDASLPARLLEWLPLVINAVARLVVGSPKCDHVTPLLHDLH